MAAGVLLTFLLGFPRRSDIPEYDVADLPALREIDIDALLPQIPDAGDLGHAPHRAHPSPTSPISPTPDPT